MCDRRLVKNHRRAQGLRCVDEERYPEHVVADLAHAQLGIFRPGADSMISGYGDNRPLEAAEVLEVIKNLPQPRVLQLHQAAPALEHRALAVQRDPRSMADLRKEHHRIPLPCGDGPRDIALGSRERLKVATQAHDQPCPLPAVELAAATFEIRDELLGPLVGNLSQGIVRVFVGRVHRLGPQGLVHLIVSLNLVEARNVHTSHRNVRAEIRHQSVQRTGHRLTENAATPVRILA